jgi:tryptophan-rich sensory protein
MRDIGYSISRDMYGRKHYKRIAMGEPPVVEHWPKWLGLVFFIPLIFGFAAQGASGTLENAGVDLPARPPSWVFIFIWTLLFLLIGLAWCLAIVYYGFSKYRNLNMYDKTGLNLTGYQHMILICVLFCLLVIHLFLWPIIYNKVGSYDALYVLFATVAVALMTTAAVPLPSRICIGPLLAWLYFAFTLNYTEVDKKGGISDAP